MALTLYISAFEEGASIPAVHSCDGDDISPLVRWDGESKETVTFALIMEDPDAPGGTFTHWIVYNLPADCHELEKNMPIKRHLGNKAIQGKNDFGKIGYRGPCPPGGEEHRYFFRLFALRKKLPPESINNGAAFYRAIDGLILDRAEFMGKYYKKTKT
jgi:Raf kinase inhibitor-like YbhB/YbcL family protein